MEITHGFNENPDGEKHLIILITGIKETNFSKISNFEYHLLAKNKSIKVLAVFGGDFAYFLKNQHHNGSKQECKKGNTVLTLLRDGTYRLYLRVKVDKERSFRLKRPSFKAEITFSHDQPIHKSKPNNPSRTMTKGQMTSRLKESYVAYEKKVKSGEFRTPYTGNTTREKEKKGDPPGEVGVPDVHEMYEYGGK